MRIILDTVFNNDDLPVINPAAGLLSDTLLAGYQMMDNKDFSGNNRNFTWSGSFGTTGAILADGTANIITTPVMEQDAMAIILCARIPSINDVGSIVNNLDTRNTPYQGMRLTKSAGTGQTVGQVDIAKSDTGITSASTQIDNGWMLKTYTWNGSNLKIIQSSGGSTDFALPSRNKGTTNPFRMNGVPTGIGGGSLTKGFTGELGFALFYGEYLGVTDAVNYMELVSQIMATRGVIV